jgi:hypothetical protein
MFDAVITIWRVTIQLAGIFKPEVFPQGSLTPVGA